MHAVRPLTLAAVQQQQQEGQGSQALLAIHNKELPVAFAEDDGAEKVVAVLRHRAARVAGPVRLQELRGQVIHQFFGLLALPAILTLVKVDAVSSSFEHFANGARLAVDGLHTANSSSLVAGCPTALRTSICPVTAAEISAVRRSCSSSMAR